MHLNFVWPFVSKSYEFYIQNQYNQNIRTLFTQQYSKLHRRHDIIVKKSFLVYTYQRLIKENILEYNFQFSPCLCHQVSCSITSHSGGSFLDLFSLESTLMWIRKPDKTNWNAWWGVISKATIRTTNWTDFPI